MSGYENESPREAELTCLHIHVSGSVAASLVPWWLHSTRAAHPSLIFNVSVSPRASTFVSLTALAELAGGHVWLDDWNSNDIPRDWREGVSGSAQGIILFPATIDTVMRLAQGRTDSPALMLMQITELPIVICDNFPARNPVINSYEEALRQRENVAYAPRIRALRASDRSEVETGLNFPGALNMTHALVFG